MSREMNTQERAALRRIMADVAANISTWVYNQPSKVTVEGFDIIVERVELSAYLRQRGVSPDRVVVSLISGEWEDGGKDCDAGKDGDAAGKDWLDIPLGVFRDGQCIMKGTPRRGIMEAVGLALGCVGVRRLDVEGGRGRERIN